MSPRLTFFLVFLFSTSSGFASALINSSSYTSSNSIFADWCDPTPVACNDSTECIRNSYCDPPPGPGSCKCETDHFPYCSAGFNNICQPYPEDLNGRCGGDDVHCKLIKGSDDDLVQCLLEQGNPDELGYCQCISVIAIPHPDPTVKNKCLRLAVSVGGACEVPEQCVPKLSDLSECDEATEKCKCTDGAVSNTAGNKCLPTRDTIDQSCEDNAQCLADDSFCSPSSGQCECNKDTAVPNGDKKKCVPIQHYIGASCEVDEQCTTNLGVGFSHCNQTLKKCTCLDNAVEFLNPNGDKCLRKAVLVGDECENFNQCSANLGDAGLVRCLSNQCECVNNAAVARPDQTKCLPIITSVNRTCEDSVQCTSGLFYAECQHKPSPTPSTCQCIDYNSNPELSDSVIAPDGKCYKLLNLGDPCNMTAVCTKLQESSDLHPSVGCERNRVDDPTKVCKCLVDDNAVEVEGRCYNKRTNGLSPCSVDEQCQPIDNTECLFAEDDYYEDEEKTCRCNSAHVNVGDNENVKCLEILYGEADRCTENLQCTKGMGQYASCTTNRCLCQTGTGYLNATGDQKCFLKTQLNQNCKLDEECQVGLGGAHSFCSNETLRKCACLPGTIIWQGGCYLSKIVGDPCTNDTECTVPIRGEVACEPNAKKCLCKFNNVPDVGGTVCRKSDSTSLTVHLTFFFIISLPKLFFS